MIMAVPNRQARDHDARPQKKVVRKKPPSLALEKPKKSVNGLKKRRRDLKRLLEHAEKLPAGLRIEHERELASCKIQIEAAEEDARRSQMIKKYHMVRFFERRKAERFLKKARQSLINCEDPSELDHLKQQVHLCDVDLQYTQYYPLNEAYSSLYKKEANEEIETAQEVNRTSPMWKVVETCMEQNKLQFLREGKLLQSTKKSQNGNAGEPSAASKAAAKIADERKEKNAREKKEKKEKKRLLKDPLAQAKSKPKPKQQASGEEEVPDDEDEDGTGMGFFET